MWRENLSILTKEYFENVQHNPKLDPVTVVGRRLGAAIRDLKIIIECIRTLEEMEVVLINILT